ncbi:MAG: hypothetical protein HY758_09315 [Nitrospirae bacterium]|nr:hypothetical protein [Nitrospirota bacterium]
MRKKAWMYILLFLTFGLTSGCASVGGRVDTANMRESDGIVFGSTLNRYFNYEDGLLLKDYRYPHYLLIGEPGRNLPDICNILCQGLSGIKEIPIGNEPHSIFALKLPAGQYSIIQISNAGDTYHNTDIRFTVEPGKVSYIGSLQIDNHINKISLLPDQWLKTYTRVVDQEELDTRNFKVVNPDISHEIEKNLMTE